MDRYFELRDGDDAYGTAALTDRAEPGHSRMYRWVPNVKLWIRDDDLLRDYRSAPIDRVNGYAELGPEEAARRIRTERLITARWVLGAYKAVPDRLSTADLELPPDPTQPRPATDDSLIRRILSEPAGNWVVARTFSGGQQAAMRKWASQARLGRIKRLAAIGATEVRVKRPASGPAVVEIRVPAPDRIVETARTGAGRIRDPQEGRSERPAPAERAADPADSVVA